MLFDDDDVTTSVSSGVTGFIVWSVSPTLPPELLSYLDRFILIYALSSVVFCCVFLPTLLLFFVFV